MNKENKSLRVGLILAVICLITIIGLFFTYAKYISQGSGQDDARVAKWGLNIPIEKDLGIFSNAYKVKEGDTYSTPTEYLDTSLTVQSSLEDQKVVAPGTYNMVPVQLVSENPPEVMYDFNIGVDVTETKTSMQESMIKWLNENPSWYWLYKTSEKGEVVKCKTVDELKAKLSQAFTQKDVPPNTLPQLRTVYLGWVWEFEDAGKSAVQNAYDTSMGNFAAQDLMSKVTVKLTGEAVQCQGCSPTPKATITGTVYRETSNSTPISGADVSFKGASTTTDSQGKFSLTAPKGPGTLRVSVEGFQIYTKDIDLQGDVKVEDIILKPEPAKLALPVKVATEAAEEGYDIPKNDQTWECNLLADDGTTLNTLNLTTNQSTRSTEGAFAEIEYAEAKTYHYQIKENGKENWTITPSDTKDVWVKVTQDAEGKFEAKAYKNEQCTEPYDFDAQTFTNKFETRPVDIELPVRVSTKSTSGYDAPQNTMEWDITLLGESITRYLNFKTKGSMLIWDSFPVHFISVGRHRFTIHETPIENWTISPSHTKVVFVKVSQNDDGTLVANAYKDEQCTEPYDVDAQTFTNTFTPPPKEFSLPIKTQAKAAEGKTIPEETQTWDYTISDPEGKSIPMPDPATTNVETTGAETQSGNFNAAEYKNLETYHYQISQTKKTDWDVDPSGPKDVWVKVSQNADTGLLEVAAFKDAQCSLPYDESAQTFANTYNPTSEKVILSGQVRDKAYEGDKQYTTLGGALVQVNDEKPVTVDADGNYSVEVEKGKTFELTVTYSSGVPYDTLKMEDVVEESVDDYNLDLLKTNLRDYTLGQLKTVANDISENGITGEGKSEFADKFADAEENSDHTNGFVYKGMTDDGSDNATAVIEENHWAIDSQGKTYGQEGFGGGWNDQTHKYNDEGVSEFRIIGAHQDEIEKPDGSKGKAGLTFMQTHVQRTTQEFMNDDKDPNWGNSSLRESIKNAYNNKFIESITNVTKSYIPKPLDKEPYTIKDSLWIPAYHEIAGEIPFGQEGFDKEGDQYQAFHWHGYQLDKNTNMLKDIHKFQDGSGPAEEGLSCWERTLVKKFSTQNPSVFAIADDGACYYPANIIFEEHYIKSGVCPCFCL